MKYYHLKLFLILILINSCSTNHIKVHEKTADKFITEEELIGLVSYLSSNEFGGRLSGSTGYDKAAKYMADQFAELGLKPYNDTSFLQPFDIEYNEILNPIKFAISSENLTNEEFELGKDFVLRGFTGSGNLTAPVLFCGYGISQPEIGYDDYAGIDVKGKVVIVFKTNPGWKLDNVDWASDLPRAKSHVAASKGAVGILFVSKPNDVSPQKTIGSVMCGEGEQLLGFPQLHITIATANKFLRDTNYDLKKLQSVIDSTQIPYSIPTNRTAEIFVRTKYDEAKRTYNVVGILPGKDDILKDKYIIVGAHLDHVGTQGNLYFPGANDNASGSSTVYHIAKAFAKENYSENRYARDSVRSFQQNLRTIIFCLFAAEESGLHGSRYFAENLFVDKSKIIAMLNFDCVGHGDSIQIGGGLSSPQLWNLISKIDSGTTSMMVKTTWKGGGADAEPFFELKIPTAYFVTTNSYTHLHYFTDKAETLNPSLFKKITQLGFYTVFELAQGKYNRELLD